MSSKISKMNECHFCKHKRTVPGNTHIKCVDPDPKMKGQSHGISNGWFYYPNLFDPIWKKQDCANFERLGNNNSDY